MGRLNMTKKYLIAGLKMTVFLSVCCLVFGKNDDKALSLVSDLLLGKNVPKEFLTKAFSDSSVTIHPEIPQKFKSPHEEKPYQQYRKIFITENRIKKGVRFYKKNIRLIEAVADSYSVDPIFLLSISGIESNFGRSHGEFLVFNAFYTIIHEMPKKANWAAKELAEYLEYCYTDKIDPHSLYGSYAGAFGFGQFIPSSFNYYAVDFDGNNIRQPYHWPDVLASIANYLRKNGYEESHVPIKKGSRSWNSIYAYNHSENYVKVVIELGEEYRKRINRRE